jgi:hypothetical protein
MQITILLATDIIVNSLKIQKFPLDVEQSFFSFFKYSCSTLIGVHVLKTLVVVLKHVNREFQLLHVLEKLIFRRYVLFKLINLPNHRFEKAAQISVYVIYMTVVCSFKLFIDRVARMRFLSINWLAY